MATETTTIRVTRETRDLLAEQARKRGISLSRLLARIALSGEREALFTAEREATLADARNPEVAAEDADWAATLEDGVG